MKPQGIHSIWGEFRWLSPEGIAARSDIVVDGEGFPRDTAGGFVDPQLMALSNTLNSLRLELPSSVLFTEGPVPGTLEDFPQVRFQSRYRLEEHNGGIFAAPSVVRLIDLAGSGTIDFASLVSAEPSAAVFFSRGDHTCEAIQAELQSAPSLDELGARLFAKVTAYCGFDHDAFFTFETQDEGLLADVLRSAQARPRP
ncbi:MAG TPA: hypothetical protein VJ397_07650 [Thermoplasmata archaeon]|nr:hypothetical protein [Thermoplasmata archaeon]